MGSPTAWLLNFESDEELAIGGTFTPSAAFARELARLREAHGDCVLGPMDWELGEGCEGMHAEAWCPTPNALNKIRKARAIVPDAPSFEILRRVNSREFCSALPGDDSEGFFAKNKGALIRGLAAHLPAEGWLLKRNFGTAGRGQLRVAGQELSERELKWVASAWRAGGLRAEPFRTIDVEFTIHGRIWQNGDARIGDPCIQTTDAQGSWQETRLAQAGELSAAERACLVASTEQCAAALAEAGYFGPFGIDAYRWLAADGVAHFHPRGEINARYTLGWRVGFGDRSTASA